MTMMMMMIIIIITIMIVSVEQRPSWGERMITHLNMNNSVPYLPMSIDVNR